MYVCCVLDALLLGPPTLPLVALFSALAWGETSLLQNFLLSLLSDACLLHKPLQIL